MKTTIAILLLALSVSAQDFTLSTNLVNGITQPTNQYIGTGSMTNGDTYQMMVNKHNANVTLLWGWALANSNAITMAQLFLQTNLLAVTNISTTTTITNGATAGWWMLSLQMTDSVVGDPAFIVARPGLGTNLFKLSFRTNSASTNTWPFRVNPWTTNTVTDVSGSGASIQVVGSKIEQ